MLSKSAVSNIPVAFEFVQKFKKGQKTADFLEENLKCLNSLQQFRHMGSATFCKTSYEQIHFIFSNPYGKEHFLEQKLENLMLLLVI